MSITTCRTSFADSGVVNGSADTTSTGTPSGSAGGDGAGAAAVAGVSARSCLTIRAVGLAPGTHKVVVVSRPSASASA